MVHRIHFRQVRVFRCLLGVLLAVCLALAIQPVQAERQYGTVIKDDIVTDTVWTEANSPYEINIFVRIAKGVTLTIEPGVTIENSYAWQSTSYNFEVEGRLLARGTAEKPITFNPGSDGWSGIRITGTAEEQNTGSVLEHVIMNGGGSGAAGSGGNLVLTFAEATVRNCQFNNGKGDGILGDDGGTRGVAHVYDSSFTNNAGYAINFQDGSVNPILQNLTATGNGYDDGNGNPVPYGGDLVYLVTPTLHGTHTWENMGLPYLVVQSTVAPDGVLTIEPGVRVRVKPSNDGLNIQGRLIAEGESGKEIRLEPADLDAGWSGLRILGSQEQPSTGTLLDYVVIPQGGFGNDCNLYIENGDASVNHSQFTTGRTSGVCLGPKASLVMSNSLLKDNTDYAMDVREPDSHFHLANITASGNGRDAIGIGGGSMLGAQIFQKSGLNTFDLHGDLIVEPTGALLMEAGTTLRAEYGRGITVHGGWTAEGTAAEPVRITGLEATPGYWPGINFEGTPERHALGRFLYTTLEYGGYGGYPLVQTLDSDVTFEHTTLQHSSSGAILVLDSAGVVNSLSSAAEASVTQVVWSKLIDLAGEAIHNNRPEPVLAMYNYWGSANGPTTSENPGGTGEPISGAVQFRPFLTFPDQTFVFLPMMTR